jgi:AAA+ ATPase superfamily predicted ATPase
MSITDLASDTWKFDLSEPEDLSVAFIAQYYRTHIGDLNNLINNGYSIDPTTYEIIDSSGTAIDTDAASIFKKIFEIFYLKKQSKSFLGANGVDQVKSINQDSIVVTLVERNQNAKNYSELAKEAKNELRQLLNSYKQNRATPRQVVGDDMLTNIGNPIVNPTTKASYPDISSNRDRRY